MRQVVSTGGPTRGSATVGGQGRIDVAQRAKVRGDSVELHSSKPEVRHNDE